MRINCTPTPQRHGSPDPDDIDRLTNAVTSAFTVDELYLFGSAATGRLTRTSDLDLAIGVRPPPRAKRTDAATDDPHERVMRTMAAERRRENAIEKTFRKAVGWRRAIDIVHLAPGEIREKTTSDDVVYAIRTEGVRLVEDGAPIPYAQAVARGPLAPNAKAWTADTKSLLYEMSRQSDRFMDWAMLRAGRKSPGPTRRHQVAFMAARAVQTALRHRILAGGGDPPIQGDLETLETLRLDGSPDSKPLPADRLRRLASNQRRWRFKGDEAPTMTATLQSVWDAAIALDTITPRKAEPYYGRRGMTRLMWSVLRKTRNDPTNVEPRTPGRRIPRPRGKFRGRTKNVLAGARHWLKDPSGEDRVHTAGRAKTPEMKLPAEPRRTPATAVNRGF